MMKVAVFKNPDELGREAALFSTRVLKQAIAENGKARLLLSTGASQFDTVKHLVHQDVDWSKVEMFHLDEYVNLPETHAASFRKYLKERFASKVNLKKAVFVNGEGDLAENIRSLTKQIREAPIDLALIGIGENGHIAFNDPPADFETKEAYIVVNLDDKCKAQQVGEGWFPTINDVPKQAISMTVYQIMQSKTILSCVPYPVKANAIKDTLEKDVTNMIPATILKNHPDVNIFVDQDSASLVSLDILKNYLFYPGIFQFNKNTQFEEIVLGNNKVGQVILSPGEGHPVAKHDGVEEYYYIISGSGLIKLGEHEYPVVEGRVVSIMPEMPHSIRNTGLVPLKYLFFKVVN